MKPSDLPDGIAMDGAAGASSAAVTTWRRGVVATACDWLVDEVPVALVFNGISHAVMLASPLDLEDFARGFALTEGLIAGRGELYGIDVEPVDAGDLTRGIEVRLDVASAAEYRIKERRRNLSGRTGCGLCGTESLDEVLRPMPTLAHRVAVPLAAVATGLRAMAARQPLQRVSGAAHAAAFCDAAGDVVLIREDVGRHNALDKLVGAMTTGDASPQDGFIAVTSRASVEMVQKTLMAGVGMLVAVSAPTALAVRVASRHGLALAGFARGDDLVCYHRPDAFGLPAEGAR